MHLMGTIWSCTSSDCSGSSGLSILSRAKQIVISELQAYSSVGGLGVDAYDGTRRSHPMADGLFLRALSRSFQSGIIGAPYARSWAESAVDRLIDNQVPFAGGKGWGLGFGHGDRPADEPYSITTGIVAQGLRYLDRSEIPLSGGGRRKVAALRKDALTSIACWFDPSSSVGGHGNGLPFFSPHVKQRVVNAVAVCVAELLLSPGPHPPSRRDLWLSYINEIESKYVVGIGWEYSDCSSLIDLLHQSLILDSLQQRTGISTEQIVDTAVLFGGPFGYVDAAVLLDTGSRPVKSERPTELVQVDGRWVRLKRRGARLWSLGAWLGVIATHDFEDDLWVRVWRGEAMSIVQELLHRYESGVDADWRYPRQVMFAVSGLAELLSRERSAIRSTVRAPSS